MKEISVLALDDEPHILSAIKRIFRDMPFGVALAATYEEAMKILSAGNIKVVMSDQRMPDISGVQFLKMVKDFYPDTMRILFTGYTDIVIAEDAINKGEVYRFINKPWDDNDLKIAVSDAIHRYDISEKNRRLMREISKQNEELLLLNTKLKNLYEAQKEFSSTVSHELRTPLAGIKSMIDVVMSETTGPLTQDQKKFLGRAKSNVDRLGILVNDILSLAKLESGKTDITLKELDINKLIEEVVIVQENVAKEQGLSIIVNLAREMPKIRFDADKITQVLNNLIGNAVKFSDNGTITISTIVTKVRNNIVVSVTDTGCGIKKEDKLKLFKKFQQLGDPSLRQKGGTGLGLAICREIIARHGGKIWVESKYGEGSKFSFILPIKERRYMARP